MFSFNVAGARLPLYIHKDALGTWVAVKISYREKQPTSSRNKTQQSFQH